MPADQPLTSRRVARFPTGQDRCQATAPRLGDPCFRGCLEVLRLCQISPPSPKSQRKKCPYSKLTSLPQFLNPFPRPLITCCKGHVLFPLYFNILLSPWAPFGSLNKPKFFCLKIPIFGFKFPTSNPCPFSASSFKK